VALEIMCALKQSPPYSEWLTQISRLPLSSAMSSAIMLGWFLREAVESNCFDHLPRASNGTYTEALRQMMRELESG
jgi:hypothetical protein